MAKTTKPIQLLVDVHVGTEIDCDDDIRAVSEDLLAAADHYELREPDEFGGSFEAWVTHVFTFDIGFRLDLCTSARNLDALDKMVEDAFADLLPDFEMLETPEVWLLVDGEPSLYLTGLSMLRAGSSPEDVDTLEKIQRDQLPAPYRSARSAA